MRLLILGLMALGFLLPSVGSVTADEIEALLKRAAESATAAATDTQAAPAIVPPAPVPVTRPTTPKAKPVPDKALPEKEVKKVEPKKPAKKAKAAAKPKKKKKKRRKTLAARHQFAAARKPADLKARAIGWYAKGCLAGGVAVPIDGPAWQVMRLSRNRNWGHPKLVRLVKRLAKEAKAAGEWPGLLVGDISQPRGGPMLTGHASHQVGLDADIWLTPMPDHRMTRKERETLSATSMLSKEIVSVNPKVFGKGQIALISRAAKYRDVERILVHPAIKKELCKAAPKENRAWLNKVRPYYGHYYHFHIRIGCPSGSNNCRSQASVPGGDSCGKELTYWLNRVKPKPPRKAKPKKKKTVKKKKRTRRKKREIMLTDLPSDCRTVLLKGGRKLTDKKQVDRSKDAGPAKKTAAQK